MYIYICNHENHQNGFVETHGLWHMMYGNRTSCAQMHELPQRHCGDNREGILFS